MLYFFQVEGYNFLSENITGEAFTGGKEREDEGFLLGVSTSGSGLRTACADDRMSPSLTPGPQHAPLRLLGKVFCSPAAPLVDPRVHVQGQTPGSHTVVVGPSHSF